MAPTVWKARDRWQWPALLAAGCVVLQALGAEALRYDRSEILAGQWWRLITANFVHLGWAHLALNLGGVVLRVLLAPRAEPVRTWCARLLMLSLGVTCGLFWLAPHWDLYVGLSGVLHGLLLLALVPGAMAGDRLSTLALVVLIGKVLAEGGAATGMSASEALIGGAVVHESHRFGILAAALWLLGALVWQRTGAARSD